MSRYSHHSRLKLSQNQNSSNDITNDMISDEDENIFGPPKLSNFGSALIKESSSFDLNNNSNNNFTKFQYFRNKNHTHGYNSITNNDGSNNKNNTINNSIELEHSTHGRDTSSPSSSYINHTSIRPSSMSSVTTTNIPNNNKENIPLNNNNNNNNNQTNPIERKTLTNKLSRTSSNHSTLNFNSSLTKDTDISDLIPSTTNNEHYNNNNIQRIKSLQQNIKDDMTSKYLERRSKRFLNSTRMNKLGPAKRASTFITTEMDHLSMNAALDTKYTHNDNKTLIDDKDLIQPERGTSSTNDYSSIVFGDLNPFQYVKKYNIPTAELPQISKIYFERQKEENRLIAMRKRSFSSSLNLRNSLKNNQNNNNNNNNTSHGNNIDSSRSNSPVLNDEDISIQRNNSNQSLPQLHSIPNKNMSSGPTPDELETKIERMSQNDHNHARLMKKREALANLSINRKEPELKKMKSDPQQISNMATENIPSRQSIIRPSVDSSHRNDGNDHDKKKPVKRVEIQEPSRQQLHKPRNPVIVVNDTEYEKVELLGRGGSSKVYKVKGPSNKTYALKRVAFDEFDYSSIDGFKGEIALLDKLRNQERVVQLIDYQMDSGVLYLIMECGDHDLSLILNKKLKGPLDVEFIRYYAREMIKCVKVVHDADIVHSDLKPANFVFVKGTLKIIDFGIANAVPDHTVNIYRETQIGTPNYMAPEALVAMNYTNDSGGHTGNRWKVGKPSDVWSIGCIIYQMIYGKPPYAGFQGQNRLLAIMNPEVKIVYPDRTSFEEMVPKSAIDLMKSCLHRDPNKRLTIDDMLQSNFFNPLMVSELFVRNLIKNAVNFGCEQKEVSNEKIDELANDVINKLSEFRI